MVFLDALTRPGRSPVIAEIKCRDPKGADLTGGRDPADIARAYLGQGAAALSVVTGRWFGGNAALLAGIAQVVAGRLPILRKDFLISDAALRETRDLGADAALITVALMRPGQTARLTRTALRLGLTPFIEVATEAETHEIPRDLPVVIAVNNSDIATRERAGTGPARSLALVQAIADRRPAATVAASRIADVRTAMSLLGAGFDALLIGTALMRDLTLLEGINAAYAARDIGAA
ncbi:hypothetical protein [Paracoccus sp. (in: a-proteobacteria)]|uniref:hypothetical protein n=1 Tax=Paracoccus sp. TaxID=267 RepID=UPI003A860A23